MADDEQNVERLDAPNQQVVRPDGSAPWEEGEGGSGGEGGRSSSSGRRRRSSPTRERSAEQPATEPQEGATADS